MSNLVVTEIADGVAHLRLNRAEKKNALTADMYTQFADAVSGAVDDAAVRCLLITGSDGVFCSGNDINDFLQNPATDDSHPVARFMRTLAACTKPVVAGVRGPAIGVGSTLLLHCDLVYASTTTRFAFPFVNLGICPEFASSYLLPRLMGHVRAAELVLLAEPFSADKALAWGLVNELLDDAEVEAHAAAAARKLAAKPPQAMRISKALLKKWSSETVMEAIREEAATFMPMLLQPEAKEAFTAFMEKRKPDFAKLQ